MKEAGREGEAKTQKRVKTERKQRMFPGAEKQIRQSNEEMRKEARDGEENGKK